MPVWAGCFLSRFSRPTPRHFDLAHLSRAYPIIRVPRPASALPANPNPNPNPTPTPTPTPTTTPNPNQAAFQENVGRQGAFPHGIAIVCKADYYAVGSRSNAYLGVGSYLASFEEYRRPLLLHATTANLNPALTPTPTPTFTPPFSSP